MSSTLLLGILKARCGVRPGSPASAAHDCTPLSRYGNVDGDAIPFKHLGYRRPEVSTVGYFSFGQCVIAQKTHNVKWAGTKGVSSPHRVEGSPYRILPIENHLGGAIWLIHTVVLVAGQDDRFSRCGLSPTYPTWDTRPRDGLARNLLARKIIDRQIKGVV